MGIETIKLLFLVSVVGHITTWLLLLRMFSTLRQTEHKIEKELKLVSEQA